MCKEADLVNGSKDGEMSRNTWKCNDGVYHYCPLCDTLEKCKDQEEPNCRFSTVNGAHLECYWLKSKLGDLAQFTFTKT